MLLDDGPPEAIEAVAADGTAVSATAVPRPDVAESFPDVPGADAAGFALSVPADKFAPDGDYEFTLRARQGDEPRFECRVVRMQAEHRSAAHHPTRSDGVLRL